MAQCPPMKHILKVLSQLKRSHHKHYKLLCYSLLQYIIAMQGNTALRQRGRPVISLPHPSSGSCPTLSNKQFKEESGTPLDLSVRRKGSFQKGKPRNVPLRPKEGSSPQVSSGRLKVIPQSSSGRSKVAPRPKGALNDSWVPIAMKMPKAKDNQEVKWYPVTKKSTQGKQPLFRPLKPRKRRLEPPPLFKFPWVNSLNRIFSQETNAEVAEGETADTTNSCEEKSSPDSSSSTASTTNVSENVVVPTISRKAIIGPNPFKKSPSHSWSIDSSDHHNKPILAPPKFGARTSFSSNSGFTKVNPSHGIGKSFGHLPIGLGPGSKPDIPSPFGSLSSSSSSETSSNSKPFKLKPSVLGCSANALSSVSKNPFASVQVKSEAVDSTYSPNSSNPSEFQPEAKKQCTDTNNLSSGEVNRTLRSSAGNSWSKDVVIENKNRNGSSVSSSNDGIENLCAVSGSRSKYTYIPDPCPSFSPKSPVYCPNSPTYSPASPASTTDYSTYSPTPTVSVDSPIVDQIKETNVCLGSNSISAASSTVSPSSPAFVPLNTNKETSTTESPSKVNGAPATSTPPPLSSKVGNAGFIFGQNLQDRVSGVSASPSTFSNGETCSSTEGNLFTAAATSITRTSGASNEGGKSLLETSREFSEKEESLKRKYDEVETVTGEEGEKNVIQMNCKLYGWVNGSWQERGRGILRLNDREIRDELHSRIVVRTQGTLTVMLNAKIWAEMSVEKPNDKTVRFTASNVGGQPNIYLVMGSPKDITLLHNSLEYRVAAARSQILDERESEDELYPLAPLSS